MIRSFGTCQRFVPIQVLDDLVDYTLKKVTDGTETDLFICRGMSEQSLSSVLEDWEYT